MSRGGVCMCGDTECPSCGRAQGTYGRTELPDEVEAVLCAALNLADIAMTPQQRALSDEIYSLASSLENTYIDSDVDATESAHNTEVSPERGNQT